MGLWVNSCVLKLGAAQNVPQGCCPWEFCPLLTPTPLQELVEM